MADINNMTTLCYIEKDDHFLMLHRVNKKKDVNKDKWIGVGGHFKEGESPEECLVREVYEETGLRLTKYRFIGVITFSQKNENTTFSEYMYLYTATAYEGEPDLEAYTKEGVLCWVKKDELLNLNLWEGDKLFLKKLVESPDSMFNMKLTYEGDKLIENMIKEY